MNTNLPLKDYTAYNAQCPDYLINMGETWVFDFSTDSVVNRERKESLKNWWMGVLYGADASYSRTMLLFWVNFFSIENHKIPYATRAFKHLETIRSYHLENFKEMLADVILKQTLMLYIKKIKTNKESLQDSVIDIILRQYTVGPLFNIYTSKEKIKRLRRLLNEWSIICDKLMLQSNKSKQIDYFEFNVDMFMHTNPVNEFISELYLFIDKLFNATPVAENVVRKLIIWLSNEELDENNDHELIRSASDLFEKSGFAIIDLVSYLAERIFFDPTRYKKAEIKSPAEFVIMALKESKLYSKDITNDIADYPFYSRMRKHVELLGQDPSDVPDSGRWIDYTLCSAQRVWLNDEMVKKRHFLKLALTNNTLLEANILSFTFLANCFSVIIYQIIPSAN